MNFGKQSVKCQLGQRSPAFLAPGTRFGEDSFSTDGVEGGFGVISGTLHLLCTWLLLHVPHLRSSVIRSWRLRTPELRDSLKQLWLLMTNTRHLFQLQDRLCPLIIKAVVRSHQTVTRTVVLCPKKEIKNLKKTTLVHQHGQSVITLNGKPRSESGTYWLE